MASSLLGRSSRLLARCSSSLSRYQHHLRGFFSSSSSSLLEKLTKSELFDKMLVKFDSLLLKRRIPYTMCRTIRGATLEGMSLSIPGNEKRYETDEVLNVFLDFDAKDAKGSGFSAELNFIHNAIFVSAHIQPTMDPSFIRLYSSWINLGNKIFYKTIHTEEKDGGLMLTLHKNPVDVPVLKMSGSGSEPLVIKEFT